MQKYGLIFDCDGTLIDSLGGALESFNYALEMIGEQPRTPEEIKKFFGSSGDRILSSLLKDEQKGLAAFEVYIQHQAQLAVNMKLHNGILQLLEKAKQAQVPMGLVTGRHARDLEVVIKPHKISDYFEVMIADSHVQNSKPAPDSILLAIKQMNLDAQYVCYVGDSVFDIKAAHAAGCKAIAALWDELAHKDDMLNANADYVAQTPAEVWEIFSRFINS